MSVHIPTWQERLPAPRAAFQCSMNCSGVGMCAVRDEDCGDCEPITIRGDSIKARDEEIAGLRASIARSKKPAVPSVAAEVDLAEKREAERYRWLRDKSEPGICAFYLSVGSAFHGVKFARKTVDEAIDAQIAAIRMLEGL